MDYRMAGTPAMHLLFIGLPALALLEFCEEVTDGAL